MFCLYNYIISFRLKNLVGYVIAKNIDRQKFNLEKIKI